MAAAVTAKKAGMQVIAGAPNIVRGGSHSGNVAAKDLVRAGAVDAFASDYVPPSLIEAAFHCARLENITLPAAIAMISDHPARMAGLSDRGRLEPGQRADLVRVRLFGCRSSARSGRRVIG
jgi:alpha-D-ribose 1-methylphosphonate 5-triphosphate diphosphatase